MSILMSSIRESIIVCKFMFTIIRGGWVVVLLWRIILRCTVKRVVYDFLPFWQWRGSLAVKRWILEVKICCWSVSDLVEGTLESLKVCEIQCKTKYFERNWVQQWNGTWTVASVTFSKEFVSKTQPNFAPKGPIVSLRYDLTPGFNCGILSFPHSAEKAHNLTECDEPERTRNSLCYKRLAEHLNIRANCGIVADYPVP